ncbi:MAG: Glu-tRNA(Gln) amidotransferase subunit GatD [Nanoarchaeota archaeon]|nr:Glu-tRNA(Gln) amidotransferase subunit GatD [Nanoarchaeota archaeon]MBU1027660.1 Glu-tRNA(Gln) amidotransferase subunit GatD [Nanoarchaeota archaeon]
MKNKAVPGDFVEIHLDKIIYEGTLLESPEDEKAIVLLKLGTGYNIGFNKKDICEIKLLERSEEEKEEIKIKVEKNKPNIAMIITGGTIASKFDSKKGGVSPLNSSEDLFKFYPEIFKIANVSRVEVPFMKFSNDMDFKDWQKLAKISEKLLNDSNIKGIIITHGTDTLHYTSAALSFFLGKVSKPVVLTYSQRSIDRASSDANLNLQCAALAAISNIAEVMLVGHASSNDNFCYAMPGTKVRKLHSSKRDAFKVINSKPFAKIYSDKIEILEKHNLRSKGKVKGDFNFEEKVGLIKFYPGQDPDILDYYIKKGYKGIVIEFLGLGQIAGKGARLSWLNKLKEVQKKGLVVCAAAQTIYGRLNPMVYSDGREFLKTGIIYLRDMLAETAYVKLGWVLGHPKWNVKEKMLENVSREFSDRLEK